MINKERYPNFEGGWKYISAYLTQWGRVTHICISNLTIIGPYNGLSPGRRQAIIRTNAGILLIELLRTNFSEISIEIHTFSFKKMHYLKMSSGKWRPFCLGLNVLKSFCWHQSHRDWHVINRALSVSRGHLSWRQTEALQFALEGEIWGAFCCV